MSEKGAAAKLIERKSPLASTCGLLKAFNQELELDCIKLFLHLLR